MSVPASSSAYVPLAVVTRGDHVESVHFGAVAVVDRDGRLLFSAGDPHTPVFTRSTLKPLQALPFVRDGGPARFGYSRDQVALLCASHSGEPRHVAAVGDMLARAGFDADALQCGTHAPGFYEVRGDTPPPPPWSPLAHNCSGKHAGMLAACAMHGWPHADYLAFDHPLQRAIRAAVAGFCDLPEGSLVAGIDGCSAPNYAVPLSSLARAFARLAAGSPAEDPFGIAAATLRDAMLGAPEMVSGQGRTDARLMEVGRGDWVAKIGAEGVQALGVASRGIGVAVKVADGGRRGLLPATVATLAQAGLAGPDQRAALESLCRPSVRNYRRTVTGSIEPVVSLARA